MKTPTSTKLIKHLLIYSVLLNLFLLSSLPSLQYIKILRKINEVEKNGNKYIDPAVSFRFRAISSRVNPREECMNKGNAELVKTTIDYKGKFVYATFQCKKENSIEEMNVALSLYHDNFNVYISEKDNDFNKSIGEITPVWRVDMGI